MSDERKNHKQWISYLWVPLVLLLLYVGGYLFFGTLRSREPVVRKDFPPGLAQFYAPMGKLEAIIRQRKVTFTYRLAPNRRHEIRFAP